MNHPPAPKKQTQNKPNSNPKQSQFKPCPERIEFTLSVIEGNGPILSAVGGFPKGQNELKIAPHY